MGTCLPLTCIFQPIDFVDVLFVAILLRLSPSSPEDEVSSTVLLTITLLILIPSFALFLYLSNLTLDFCDLLRPCSLEQL